MGQGDPRRPYQAGMILALGADLPRYLRCGPHGPGSPSADGGEPSSTGGRLGRNGSPLPAAGCDPPHGPLSPPSDSLGTGSASGPGSWPPANFTSAATRASTGGWVSKILENPSRGLSMHISMTAEVAPGSSPRPSILRSAEIIASGFLVSSTEPASARYSRWRDSARRIRNDNA